jgi:hypothetical protein
MCTTWMASDASTWYVETGHGLYHKAALYARGGDGRHWVSAFCALVPLIRMVSVNWAWAILVYGMRLSCLQGVEKISMGLPLGALVLAGIHMVPKNWVSAVWSVGATLSFYRADNGPCERRCGL